jgi:hypothetical protein
VLAGDTFPVGCKHDENIIYHRFFAENPDSRDARYNTTLGVYAEGCGLNQVDMSWGHDEYMYRVRPPLSPVSPVSPTSRFGHGECVGLRSFYTSAYTLGNGGERVHAAARGAFHRAVPLVLRAAQQGCVSRKGNRSAELGAVSTFGTLQDLDLYRTSNNIPTPTIGAYNHLLDATDRSHLEWLKTFNQHDLYTKSRDRHDLGELKAYYQGLITKYFPDTLRW